MLAAVIADDLTGAADAGAQFVRAGYRTGVALWGEPLPPAPGLDAVVVDTDSRGLPPAEAAARVAAVARTLRRAPLLLKKVDSTLQGPIGAEVHAALEASGRARVVFAPAFPATGRITRGGVQHVDGRPVGDLRQILAGSGAWVIADAEQQDVLVSLVRGVADPQEVLWVGSAGLARALGAVHPGQRDLSPATVRSRGVLVAIGSATPTARAQVSRLAASACVEEIPLSVDAHADAVTRAAGALAASRCALVHTGALGGEDAGRIPGTLAGVVARVAGEGDVGGLVLSGGGAAVPGGRGAR